jgi:hypothetical protein
VEARGRKDAAFWAGISQSRKVSNQIPTTIMRLFSLGIRRQLIKNSGDSNIPFCVQSPAPTAQICLHFKQHDKFDWGVSASQRGLFVL